jgi:hypothetical protein
MMNNSKIMASLLICLSVHKLWIHFYSLNTSFRGFHWYLQTTTCSAPRKSNKTRNYKPVINRRNRKSTNISFFSNPHFPPTHDKLTPTKISETSVCQECKYTLAWCVKQNEHSNIPVKNSDIQYGYSTNIDKIWNIS